MLRISLRGLVARRRRLVGTVLGVFLGVALLSGTLVLNDTLRANFDDLFGSANQGTDAVVRSSAAIPSDPGEPDAAQRGLVDGSLVEDILAVDGVAAAAPAVEGYGRLIGKDGRAVGGNGPPTLSGNWIEDPDLNPYRLVEGRAPRGDDEVVINRGAAAEGDLHVGDRTIVQTPDPVQVEIVGISTFGSADGLGRVTFTAFTLSSAQKNITGDPGGVTSIQVRAEGGVSQTELVRRIRAVLPAGIEAITGVDVTEESTDAINRQFLDLFTTFLLVFAGVALLVATFGIHNTFSILVAQRTRESALLRAVGAARGQILTSVVLEAVLVGLGASVAGLFGGLGIAGLLKALFDVFGFALPAGGLVFSAGTALTSLMVGVTVTIVAAAAPAVRASRVPPLAALRDVAVDRTAGSAARAGIGLTLTVLGTIVVLAAVTGGGGGVLARAALGAVLTIAGVVVLGPVVARSMSRVIGSPLPRLRGITGSLARRNAMRNPRRTAGTASALMVGVGVVTLFTLFAASLKASIDRSVTESFRGDFVISAGRFGGGGLSPRLAVEIAELPEVHTAVGLGLGTALIDGDSRQVGVVDADSLGAVLDLHVTEGSLAGLGDRRLAVSEQAAEDPGWGVGTAVPVTFADGTTADFTVGAVFETSTIAGDYLLTRSAWAPHAVQEVDSTVLIQLEEGTGPAAGRAAIQRVAEAYGAPDVQDGAEYADSVTANVNAILGLVYVMLALAIIIALMGIANTLSLSIHERTRELGLLRAVGQTRGQLRSMVRWESVIIAVFGTLGGLGVGVFLGWALVQAASGPGIGSFAAPPGQLLAVLVAGAAAGVVAGIRPARRAARLDVLDAIATE